MPVTRVSVTAALVAIGSARDRSRALGRLALAAVLPAAHLGFRWLYYGQWLPNTYYLKVDGLAVSDRLALGGSYLAYFAAFYWLLLGLADDIGGERCLRQREQRQAGDRCGADDGHFSASRLTLSVRSSNSLLARRT